MFASLSTILYFKPLKGIKSRAILSHIWTLASKDIDKESCYSASYLDLTPEEMKNRAVMSHIWTVTPKDNTVVLFCLIFGLNP